MYSVLIVDDEEPVLESYGFILEGGVDGFRLAGKARSGYEAIKLIYELRPDVVFMDIRMPGIDGLDTIAEVHDRFPDTVFVLSTAYERFDLARRAIPLGVHAYLVKPVTKKVFTDTLADIRALLDRRKTSTHPMPDENAVHSFMKSGLWKEIDRASWEGYREAFGLESDRGLVMFIGVDWEGKDASFAEINARLERRHRFLFSHYFGLGMYFFPGDISREDLGLETSVILESALPNEMVRFTGIGAPRDFGELHLSCAEALGELQGKKNRTDASVREQMLIVQLRRGIGLADPSDIRRLLDSFLEEAFSGPGNSGRPDLSGAKMRVCALFTLLVDDCTGCYRSHSSEVAPFHPAEEIVALSGVQDLEDWAQRGLDRLHGIASQQRGAKYPVTLMKAIAFVNENYHRQIQLSDAAEAAAVSPAYLSRLFGESMDSSFIDYLTSLRVESAERLIREKRMSIKEVSFAVGYQDPNYFSKIFRKMTGISPSMYAERMRYETE